MVITYNSFSVELTLAEAIAADFASQVVMTKAHNTSTIFYPKWADNILLCIKVRRECMSSWTAQGKAGS